MNKLFLQMVVVLVINQIQLNLSAKSLMQLGYKNVQSLQGGWDAWNEAYPSIKE